MIETNSNAVKTVDQDGNAPKNRISDASGFYTEYMRAMDNDMVRDVRFASLRGIYDGGLPIDPKTMEEQGLADLPNINTRQFQAKINTYVSTWTDHDTGGDSFAEVKVKPIPGQSPELVPVLSEALTKFFNEAILEWEDCDKPSPSHFIFESTVRNTQMGIFGLGVPHFASSWDWRFESIPTRNVLVPQGTKLNLKNCPAMFIRKPYTVTQLYWYAQNDRTGKWNKEAVMDLLYTRTSVQNGGYYETRAEWQNRVRDNDTILNESFQQIDLVECYVQEFNTYRNGDGITRAIIARWGGLTLKTGEKVPEKDGTLYFSDREFKNFSETIIPFADNTGPEGDWHGVKGFGDLIYDGCHFANIMFNYISAGAIIAGMPIFKAGSDADRQKLNQIVMTRFGVLFPDVELQQLQIKSDINGSMAIMGENNQILNTNTRIFPQNDKTSRGDQPTATQVNFDRADQAQFSSLQIKYYRTTGADPLFAEMYRRLTKDGYPESAPGGHAAANFRKKCKEAGIPKEVYQKPALVRCNRNGGSGNMGLDVMKSEKAMQVATPGKGQMAARRQTIAALYGREMVDVFIEPAPEPIAEDVVIGLENNTIQDGQQPHAYPFQPAERHLGEADAQGMGHLAVLIGTIEACKVLESQGIDTNLEDAIKLVKILASGIGHCTEHVNFLLSVPASEAIGQQYSRALGEIGQYAKRFSRIVMGLNSQQQANDPKMSAADQAKLITAQAQSQATLMKAQADIEASHQSHLAKLANLQETFQLRSALKEADHATTLGIKTEQALATQQQKRAQTAQDLQHNQVRTAQDLHHNQLTTQQQMAQQAEQQKQQSKQ